MAGYNKEEDLISCVICHDMFTDPRYLSCSHTFCQECLQSHINTSYNNNGFPCPICRKHTPISDSIRSSADQFPRNIALADAIEAFKGLKQRVDNERELLSVSDSLSSVCDVIQHKADDAINKLHNELHVSVVQTMQEIVTAADDIISEFSSAVRKKRDELIKELEKYQQSARKHVVGLFTEHAQFVNECRSAINLQQTGSNSDIENKIRTLKTYQEKTPVFFTSDMSIIPATDLRIRFSRRQRTSDECFEADVGSIEFPDFHRNSAKRNLTSEPAMDPCVDKKPNRPERTLAIETKTSSDQSKPALKSLLALESDEIIVSDFSNKKIKCFSSQSTQLVCEKELSFPPFGLARSPDHRLLVTLPQSRQIICFDVQNGFREAETLKTEKSYFHIAVLPDCRLVVTVWHESVDILDRNGVFVQSVSSHLVKDLEFLVISDDHLIVAGEENALKSVTLSGELSWVTRDSTRLGHIKSVACDVDGSIYVCDDKRKCIVQLSGNGDVIGDVITCNKWTPEVICCSHKTIYVANRNGKIFKYILR